MKVAIEVGADQHDQLTEVFTNVLADADRQIVVPKDPHDTVQRLGMIHPEFGDAFRPLSQYQLRRLFSLLDSEVARPVRPKNPMDRRDLSDFGDVTLEETPTLYAQSRRNKLYLNHDTSETAIIVGRRVAKGCIILRDPAKGQERPYVFSENEPELFVVEALRKNVLYQYFYHSTNQRLTLNVDPEAVLLGNVKDNSAELIQTITGLAALASPAEQSMV